MKNQTPFLNGAPLVPGSMTTLAKPSFSQYFTTREKWRMAAMGTALAAGAWGAAHFKGWDQFLDPTYPLATAAELTESNYPNRTAMQQVLLERVRVVASCNITTRSYGTVSVYSDRPFDTPSGADEREVPNDDDVLPRCAEIIDQEFRNGRAISVTYEVNVKNAWSGSSGPPGFGSFERGDENGNGIPYEASPISLGNKWHDNDAIDRLGDAQTDYMNLKQELRDRSSRTSNILGRAWQATKDTAYGMIGWETLTDQIQQRLWNSVTGSNQNEVRPS